MGKVYEKGCLKINLMKHLMMKTMIQNNEYQRTVVQGHGLLLCNDYQHVSNLSIKLNLLSQPCLLSTK